ncbi:MAG TPA: hypothetical protein VGA73_09280, partial [Candidatus Binatia bacterium]
MESGLCGASWHEPAFRAIFIVCTVIVAAGIVVVPALVAPARRFAVAVVGYIAGAVFALYMLIGGFDWGTFLAAALSGSAAFAFAAAKWQWRGTLSD